MTLTAVYRMSFAVAALDVWMAVICAATGNVGFVAFMVLAGLMAAYGTYLKRKVEELGE